MKHLLTLLLICVCTLGAFAQQARLSGSLTDTVNYKPMAYSSVSLIRQSDSVLVSHQWAKEDGSFLFEAVPPNRYLLRVTRPSFADYEEEITVNENEQKTLQPIALISKANLLREVIIKEKRNAITIKGDTTEYFVDSFLVNKESNVEDLLKKLPGIQVDKDGKIKAQGQEVKKILVDGEEFFGDDPTVATKNIKATNVEAVQVFDKKSEEAAFTGIEDGQKDKTINLKLKEDAKKGYFGKASVGFGTQNRYEHDAMFNKFKGRQKISAFVAGSNTNKTGLNWEDANRFGSGSNTFVDEESGNVYSYYSGNNEQFDGVGIPRTFYAGGVYTDKFKSDTHSLNLNIKYQLLNVDGFNNNYTKFILPDTLYYNNQLNQFSNTRQLTKGNGKYEWKLDSLTTIRITASVDQATNQNNNQYVTENLNGANIRVNDNRRTETNENKNNTYSIGLYLGHKFKTKGRSISITLDQRMEDGQSEGFLLSTANFYEGGLLLSQTAIDQKRTSASKVNNLTANINYTEPLSTKWFIVADVNSKINVNQSERFSFDKDAAGNYTVEVDSLSNKLRYDIAVNRGGLALKYNTKTIVYSIGGKVSYTDLRQKDVETQVVQNQYFLNLFPAANFQYKIRNNSSFSIGYNGRTRQPSLQQIQPIIDNINPLSLTIGNPNLGQSFTNSFNLNYNNYKPVSGSGMYASASFSMIQNDFASRTFVNSVGQSINQTINVNGNQNAYAYINYWSSIKGMGLDLGVSLNTSYNRNNNVLNELNNTNTNYSAGPGLEMYYEYKEVFYMNARADFDFNQSLSSIRPDVVTQFWVTTYYAEANYKIAKRYEIGSDVTFNYRQQTETFSQNLNTIIWNAYVKALFLEKKNLEAKIGCNDLLNQNIGFRRNAQSNFVNENTYTILKRYFMVSLTYNFSQGGAGGGDNE